MRCAKCRHSWFQHGPDLPERAAAPLETAAAAPAPGQGAFAAAGGVDTAPAPAPVAPPTAAPTPPPAPPPTPEPEPAPATWSSREPSAPVPTAVDDADDYSPFDHQPPFRPRRNPARLWTIAAVAFALTARPADFARFAPRLLDSDDAAAVEIVGAEVAAVAEILRALQADALPVTFIGGLGPFYAGRLAGQFAVRVAQGSALDGALALAEALA